MMRGDGRVSQIELCFLFLEHLLPFLNLVVHGSHDPFLVHATLIAQSELPDPLLLRQLRASDQIIIVILRLLGVSILYGGWLL